LGAGSAGAVNDPVGAFGGLAVSGGWGGSDAGLFGDGLALGGSWVGGLCTEVGVGLGIEIDDVEEVALAIGLGGIGRGDDAFEVGVEEETEEGLEVVEVGAADVGEDEAAWAGLCLGEEDGEKKREEVESAQGSDHSRGLGWPLTSMVRAGRNSAKHSPRKRWKRRGL